MVASSQLIQMARGEGQKRVGLTCKCGMSYALHTIYDLRRRCMNPQCGSTLNMSSDELWRYQERLMALMEALGLGRDYEKELDDARKLSKKLASPYTIDIVEIP
jgi:hypothetical protein